MYEIYRECWNQRTFNGHTDNPYWRISWAGFQIGLKDSGAWWDINGNHEEMTDVDSKAISEAIRGIVSECNINIGKIFKHA